tara:strand:- start:497 stop:1798 length:1302 start_codon:yes stop_codon:yes gene_type:complete
MEMNLDLGMEVFRSGCIYGNPGSIFGDKPEEFITSISMLLPERFLAVPEGTHNISFEIDGAAVVIEHIHLAEKDPIYTHSKGLSVGLYAGGKELLPYKAFSDNRGKYPAVLATVIFTRRVASWLDESHPTGMKYDGNTERSKLVPFTEDEDKLLALLVINRLLEKLNFKNLKAIVSDDVSSFFQRYHNKSSGKELLFKDNYFCSKDAFRKAAYNYLLPTNRASELVSGLESFSTSRGDISIEDEETLFSIVYESVVRIADLIERKQAIEPFWDGERSIKLNGEIKKIDRQPKPETKTQSALHLLFTLALNPLGIHVIREANEGSGFLDFQFLYTTNSQKCLAVALELKLAHHKRIRHGIESQLPAYMTSIGSRSGILLVLWFKDGKYFTKPKATSIGDLREFLSTQARETERKNNLNLRTSVIDVSIKLKASI